MTSHTLRIGVIEAVTNKKKRYLPGLLTIENAEGIEVANPPYESGPRGTLPFMNTARQ